MKAYKEAWEKANAEAANRPITSDNPAGDQEYPVLLTLASVSWYVHGHGVLPDVPLYRLESQPINGGNLNFAWRCGDRDDSSKSVFVKQAPDFIKCLGADYKLTNKRAEVEANVLRALRDISADNAPEVLVYDDYRCAMILEDLRDFRLLRDDLLRGVVEESVAASLGRFCAKVYNETRAKPDAYFSEMLGDDDNGAMRAITRDYVFTKPFQEDETNREIDGFFIIGFPRRERAERRGFTGCRGQGANGLRRRPRLPEPRRPPRRQRHGRRRADGRHRRGVRLPRPRGSGYCFSDRGLPLRLLRGRRPRRGRGRRRASGACRAATPSRRSGAPTPTRARASRKWTRSAASWAASCCGASWARRRCRTRRERAELLLRWQGAGARRVISRRDRRRRARRRAGVGGAARGVRGA